MTEQVTVQVTEQVERLLTWDSAGAGGNDKAPGTANFLFWLLKSRADE